jgi:WD40 repeat protein
MTIEEDSVKKRMRSGGLSFIECPWRCGCVVVTGHMEQHLLWCRLAPDPATAVACANASAGCSFTGLRPAAAEHLLTCEYTALATVLAQFAAERNSLKTAIKMIDDDVKKLKEERSLLKQTITTVAQARRAGVPFVVTPSLQCDVGQPGQTMQEFLHLRELSRLHTQRSNSSTSDTSAAEDRLHATQIYDATTSRTSMRGSAVDDALVSSMGKAFKTTSAGSHFGLESAEEARRPSVLPPPGSSSSLQHWLPSKRTGQLAAHEAGVFCISVAVLGGDCTDVGSFNLQEHEHESGRLHGQTLMFTGGGDGMVKVWSDLNTTPSLQRTLRGHASSVRCIAAMAASAFSGGQDKVIRLWDVEAGVCSSAFIGHTGTVESLIAYGDLCLSMASDRSIRLWDVRQQRCTQVFETGSRGSYGMSLYNGNVVSAQGSILFEANLRTMKTQRWQTHASVSTVNVSAAVGTAAAGQGAAALSSAIERVNMHRKEDAGEQLPSHDYSAAHWQAQTLSAGAGPIGYYTSISSNVNGCGGQHLRGDTLYAGNVDCSISVWNMQLHCDVKQAALKGHKDFVRDVQSYGAHLFSASDDGCVKCWDPSKLLSAARTLAPTAFGKAEQELAAEDEATCSQSKISNGAHSSGADAVGKRGESEFDMRSQRAQKAAKVALSVVSFARTATSGQFVLASCFVSMLLVLSPRLRSRYTVETLSST